MEKAERSDCSYNHQSVQWRHCCLCQRLRWIFEHISWWIHGSVCQINAE